MPNWYRDPPGAHRVIERKNTPWWGIILAVVAMWALTAEMVANSWMLMEASRPVPEHGYKITVAGNVVPWFAD